jgi:hypothetical protein
VEEPETEAQSYPIIVRSFEPVADLDDRLQRIFTVLSLPPLEELSAQRPCLTRCASRVTSDVAESPSEPPLGMPSGVWGTKIRVAPRESRDLQVGRQFRHPTGKSRRLLRLALLRRILTTNDRRPRNDDRDRSTR